MPATKSMMSPVPAILEQATVLIVSIVTTYVKWSYPEAMVFCDPLGLLYKYVWFSHRKERMDRIKRLRWQQRSLSEDTKQNLSQAEIEVRQMSPISLTASHS